MLNDAKRYEDEDKKQRERIDAKNGLDKKEKMAVDRVSCSKYLLLVFNTLFLLAGLGILAGGAYVYVDGSKYNITITTSIGVMVAGGVIFLISFLGCFGAMWENKIMLYSYSVLLILLTCGQIAFIIIAYVDQPLLDQASTNGWDEASNTTKLFIQENLDCCGFYNSTDREAQPCPTTPNITGCYTQLETKIAQYLLYVEVVGYCLIGFEIVMLAFTFAMACGLGTDDERRQKELEQAREMNREMNDYA